MERRKYLGRYENELIRSITSRIVRIDEEDIKGYVAHVQINEVVLNCGLKQYYGTRIICIRQKLHSEKSQMHVCNRNTRRQLMKNQISLILSLFLLLSLTACGGDMAANNQNQSRDNNQSGNNIPDNKETTTLVFEAMPSPITAPTPPEFTCAECGAYCNAYDHDSLCGICHLPAGISADIWSLGTSGIEREIREMICRGTDMHHGGSAIMALPGGFDELLELYALHLTQDEEAIVERLKKIACTSRDCACPYRTKAALDSIFTDFLDMNEIRFPVIYGGKPRQITILHEGHNNKINISYGIINGMDFTVAVHPMYSTNEDRIKNWLDSLSPVRTLGEIEIYLSREPSEPEDKFSYRGVTHANFTLNVNGQYVAIYVSNPPCVMPSQEEMKGHWSEYLCDYCNNVSQGPRCFGPPVDVQAALHVIVQFEFRTLL